MSDRTSDQSLVIVGEPVDFLQSPVDIVYILVVSVGIECRLNSLSINASLLEGRYIQVLVICFDKTLVLLSTFII